MPARANRDGGAVTPRLIAAWRRYWFTPASLTDPGVSRIALVAIILYLNGSSRYRPSGLRWHSSRSSGSGSRRRQRSNG